MGILYSGIMKLILSLDQHKLGFFDDGDKPIDQLRLRKAARAVLFDQDGRVAIMYFSKTGGYKLPGGGMDQGEEIESTLHREVLEETGYMIENIMPLGIVEEDRYFCGMHQTSYCFVATVTEHAGMRPTNEEILRGMQLVWADSIDAAIALIEGGKTTDEEGSTIGAHMMRLRDASILRASARETAQ